LVYFNSNLPSPYSPKWLFFKKNFPHYEYWNLVICMDILILFSVLYHYLFHKEAVLPFELHTVIY
jgi:hypothetical protein